MIPKLGFRYHVSLNEGHFRSGAILISTVGILGFPQKTFIGASQFLLVDFGHRPRVREHTVVSTPKAIVRTVETARSGLAIQAWSVLDGSEGVLGLTLGYANTVTALLHHWCGRRIIVVVVSGLDSSVAKVVGRSSLHFPGGTYPTGSVMGMPRAGLQLSTEILTCSSATGRPKYPQEFCCLPW